MKVAAVLLWFAGIVCVVASATALLGWRAGLGILGVVLIVHAVGAIKAADDA